MANQSKSKQKAAVAGDERPNPGDEAAAGTLGTGEDTCRKCGGSGKLEGKPCPDCGGAGIIIEGIGGA
jgi:hypothetical protein